MAFSAIGLQGPIGVQDNRNHITNGEFNIWQRGVTVECGATGTKADGSTSVLVGTTIGSSAGIHRNAFVADRWRMFVHLGAAGTTAPGIIASRGKFDLGDPSGAENASNWYMNIFVGAGCTSDAAAHAGSCAGNCGGTANGSFVALVQDIEDVKTLENKSGTVSFWAKSDIAGQRIAPVLIQVTGGAGGGLISGSTGGLGHTLDNTWRKYETSFTVPGLESDSLGTSGDNALQLQLLFQAHAGRAGIGVTFELGGVPGSGKTGNIKIAQVQLEQGTKVTEFDQKDRTVEIMQCQRYYEKSYNLDISPDTVSNSPGYINRYADNTGSVLLLSHAFITRKRIAPTVVYFNPTTTGENKLLKNNSANVDVTSTTTGETGLSTITLNSGAAIGTYSFHYTANSELNVTTI